MKRTYISPEIKTHKLQSLQLLAGSDPTDPTGGGDTTMGGGDGTVDKKDDGTGTIGDSEFDDLG